MTKTENTVWQRYTYYLPFYLEGNLQTKLYGELRANQCLNYLRLQIYNSEGDDRRTYENKNSLRMSVSRTYTSLCKVQPGAGICTLTHNWTLVSYSIVTFILKSPCSIVMYLFLVARSCILLITISTWVFRGFCLLSFVWCFFCHLGLFHNGRTCLWFYFLSR